MFEKARVIDKNVGLEWVKRRRQAFHVVGKMREHEAADVGGGRGQRVGTGTYADQAVRQVGRIESVG